MGGSCTVQQKNTIYRQGKTGWGPVGRRHHYCTLHIVCVDFKVFFNSFIFEFTVFASLCSTILDQIWTLRDLCSHFRTFFSCLKTCCCMSETYFKWTWTLNRCYQTRRKNCFRSLFAYFYFFYFQSLPVFHSLHLSLIYMSTFSYLWISGLCLEGKRWVAVFVKLLLPSLLCPSRSAP